MDADRAALRRRRRGLEPVVQAEAAVRLAVQALPIVRHATRIASYVAVRGEIDTSPLLAELRPYEPEVYLPRLRDSGLVFARAVVGVALVAGRYGIGEPPDDAPVCPAEHLDVALVPIVGFDRTGTRLGSGGGVYDRTFAFRLEPGASPPPLLVGVAYSWQELADLERRPWDVPLDVIVTEREVIHPDIR